MTDPIGTPFSLPGMDGNSQARAQANRAVKDLVRKHFGLDSDAPVFVAEINCGEIECPDAETVIAIFIEGQRRELRFEKPVAALTGADIAAASCGRPKARE
jgi:hypothetical protein